MGEAVDIVEGVEIVEDGTRRRRSEGGETELGVGRRRTETALARVRKPGGSIRLSKPSDATAHETK